MTSIGLSWPRVCSHLVLLLSYGLSAHAVSVRTCPGDAVPGRYIVRTLSAGHARFSTYARFLHKAVDNSVSIVVSELSDEQVSALTADPSVLSIEQDCVVQLSSVPNDPVPSQYLFPRASLNLEAAWSARTDASSVIVAVSDTGVDLTHPDLAPNLWTNTIELHGLTGVDDDGNGCIDDIHGCDFGDGDGDPSPFASSSGDHGTHVAGIIGAVGNNGVGSTGVAWQASLMAVKGFDAGGNGSTSALLETIYYAVNNGARVINCSWGSASAPSSAEIEAFQWALANGVLPVVAAGNNGVDAAGFSPAGIDGVLAVGSVNSNDVVSGFSNFGSHVAVYAPGGDARSVGGSLDEFIYSTLPVAHGSYGTLRGTSMSAPFVSGLAALVFAVNPAFSAADVRSIIVSSSRHVVSRLPDGTSSTIAIPDAAAALSLAASYTPSVWSKPSSGTASYTDLSSSAPSTAPSTTTTTSTSCGLAREHAPARGSVFLLLPLICSLLLRRRLSIRV